MKSIKGFENYLIEDSGKIFSLFRNKCLKPLPTNWGYYRVGLRKQNKTHYKYISRLVAEAFISNPDNKPQINHKDGNKFNNNVSNLEWVTQSENMQHAIALGLWKRSPNSGMKPIPVNVYDYKTGKLLSTHPSMSDAARSYGLQLQNAHKVLQGKYKQTKGLTFNKIQ
ncbi:hypothetical protein LCGC14_0277760 [marine sediment metagenome]|uniref:HNH nuclease domain-containing protein n=1 Tax=marine sediment metagenome TaxID=412755 RepID=A0A0F9UDK8_9ZZZZ